MTQTVLLLLVNLMRLSISTPDFTIDESLLQGLTISVEYVPEGDCQYEEGCVSGYGERILARFDTGVANIGTSDFVIGDPTQAPNTVYDPCHQHYHYTEWMEYQIFAQDDVLQQNTLIDGFKQGFCLMDVTQYDGYEGDKSQISANPQYDCSHQGVSMGWMDIYDQHISCQFADITDLDAGTYTLKTIVNPNQVVTELDYTNNEANTTFYYNGDINSYYWSDYIPSKSDVRIWRRAMNSMLNEIENATDTKAQIFDLFASADLCFNPGGCIPNEYMMWWWYIFDTALSKFRFKIDQNSIIYGTGYFYAEAEWTMISQSGCKFRKSDTNIHVYYNSDGTMGRTRLTSEENNALSLFLDLVIYPAFGGSPFYCQKGDEYLDEEDGGSSAAAVGHESEYLRNDEMDFVTKKDLDNAVDNIYALLLLCGIPVLTIFAMICMCLWMNKRKSIIAYDEVDNKDKE